MTAALQGGVSKTETADSAKSTRDAWKTGLGIGAAVLGGIGLVAAVVAAAPVAAAVAAVAGTVAVGAAVVAGVALTAKAVLHVIDKEYKDAALSGLAAITSFVGASIIGGGMTIGKSIVGAVASGGSSAIHFNDGNYIGGALCALSAFAFAYGGVRVAKVDKFIKDNVPPDFQRSVREAFTSNAKVTKLTEDMTVYRYHGGVSDPKNFWVTPNQYSNPSSSLALPPGNSTQYMSTFTIPKGTTILQGSVAPNFGQTGGGYQIYLPNPSVLK